MSHPSRRCVLGAGVAALAGTAFRAQNSLADESRDHRRSKISVAAYSFRQALQDDDPKWTLEDFIRQCSEWNVDGVELTSYYFPKDFDRNYLIHLKQLTHRLGLDISGTAIANDFCLPEGPEREKSLAHTRKWIEYAAIMGAPCIRIFAGNVPPGMSNDMAIANCIKGIEQSLAYAAEEGVILALENHGGITATPELMLKIVNGVEKSPWFGVNFDGGNFQTADPYASLERIAPYAVNAQLKVEVFPNGRREPADLERVAKILRAANYRGYVVLEYEAEEDPFVAVPKHLESMRRIFR